MPAVVLQYAARADAFLAKGDPLSAELLAKWGYTISGLHDAREAFKRERNAQTGLALIAAAAAAWESVERRRLEHPTRYKPRRQG